MAAAFTQEDLALLEKTISVRKSILDGIDIAGIKGDVQKVASAVNLLDSIDRTIVNVAKVRVDETGVKNQAEVQERATAFILGIHERLNKAAHQRKSETVPETVKARDVAGISYVGVDNVSIADFKKT